MVSGCQRGTWNFLQLSFFILLCITLNTTECIASNLYTIKLSSRNSGNARSGLNRLRSSLIANSNSSEPLADFFNGTDLQWFGNVSFGTPPQTLTVVFDTGSGDAEIPDVSCQTCKNQKQFFSNESSTFTSLNETTILHFATGVGVTPSDFENLTVLEVKDTMTILNLSAPQIPFLLITDQTAGFDEDPFSGIVGMTLSPNQSLFRILNVNKVPSIFSLFLTPKSIGEAEITIGGIDQSKVNGTLTFAPVGIPPVQGRGGFWSLNSSQIAVNGQTTSLLSDPLNIIFDSGTSNLVFEPNITQAMYGLISPKITAHGNLGAFGIPCSEISSINASISFTFTDTSGQSFNLTVPPEELSVGPFEDDPQICQTVINAMDGFNILGGSLLKHYYSVWDVDHNQMGFVLPSNQSSTGGSTNSSSTHHASSSASVNEGIRNRLAFSLVAILSTFVFA